MPPVLMSLSGGNQAADTIFMMRLFDVAVPVVTSALAIWAVYSFSITEERAHEIRQELEQRRGTAAPEPV